MKSGDSLLISRFLWTIITISKLSPDLFFRKSREQRITLCVALIAVFYICYCGVGLAGERKESSPASKPAVEGMVDAAGGLAEQLLKFLFSDRPGPQHDITSSKPVVAMLWGPAPALPKKK